MSPFSSIIFLHYAWASLLSTPAFRASSPSHLITSIGKGYKSTSARQHRARSRRAPFEPQDCRRIKANPQNSRGANDRVSQTLLHFIASIDTPSHSHWLHRVRRRTSPALYEANTRMSTILPTNDARNFNTPDAIRMYDHHLRRVMSASSIPPFLSFHASIEKRLQDNPTSDFDIMFDIRGHPIVVSNEKLISPRPLGPTHILVVHADPDRPTDQALTTGTHSHPTRSKKPLPPLPYSTVIELPINDLLFILNVPNIPTPAYKHDHPIPSPLPPRLHKELPRVLLGPVPHLETFPELVVYLHTQNQAELFRRLIPEWIRDALHPLRDTGDHPRADRGDTVLNPFSWDANSSSSRGRTRVLPRMLGILRPTSPSPSVDSLLTSRSSVDSCSSGKDSVALFTSVMQDLVSITQDHSAPTGSGGGEDDKYYYDVDGDGEHGSKPVQSACVSADPLLQTLVLLNALRDNLEYFGCFGPAVWQELEFYRKLLVRAVSFRARVA